jgi:hypothetical protein
MTTKRTPAAAVTTQRPAVPITTAALQAAVQPLLELLGLPDADDVVSIHIGPSRVAVVLIPRHRGKRQHDSRLRVTYPVVYDE